MRASGHGLWASWVVAMVIAGCGGSAVPRPHDASGPSDALASDQSVADAGAAGADGRADGAGMNVPCFRPTDCSAGLLCCLTFDGSGGVVNCQASCVPGDSTFVACTTDADCPATRPTCIQIGSTPTGKEFRVCSSS